MGHLVIHGCSEEELKRAAVEGRCWCGGTFSEQPNEKKSLLTRTLNWCRWASHPAYVFNWMRWMLVRLLVRLDARLLRLRKRLVEMVRAVQPYGQIQMPQDPLPIDHKDRWIPHPLCTDDPKTMDAFYAVRKEDRETLTEYLTHSKNPRWAASHLVRVVSKGLLKSDRTMAMKLSECACELASKPAEPKEDPPLKMDVPLGLALVGGMAVKREVALVRGEERSWVRIGRYDRARRRSLWCRLVGEDVDGIGTVQAIELCSGREGDDAYVKFTPADPQWEDLCDLFLRVEHNCGLHKDTDNEE